MAELTAHRFFESPADGNYFFGYFDTPQVSAGETRILALKCDFLDRVPTSDDEAQVGWFDLTAAAPVFYRVGTTRAFNWQQGCMLQFLGPGFDSKIVYNTFEDGRFVAVIADIATGETRQVGWPVYGLFPDGRHALTIDFARHYWCRRGYSYGNIVDETKNRPVVEGDAIWKVDLESGEARKIVTIEQMLAFHPVDSMNGATHYLEHMTVNPSGDRFAFLHRWRYPEGIHSRFLIADAEGGNLRILNDSGRMSHFCWCDDRRIIGYGGFANRVNRLRKNRALIKSVFRFLLPVYHRLVRDSSGIAKVLTGDSYLEFDTATGKAAMIAPSMRAEDGHPAMLPGGDVFITDTYARARHGNRPRLCAFDLRSDEAVVLDELGSIAEHDETPVRCDLHPRVSPSGHVVSIDTMDRGMRGVYAYRLEREERP